MKHLIIALFTCLFFSTVTAQGWKNSVKCKVLYGDTPYEEIKSPGLALQYERILGKHFSVDASANFLFGYAQKKGNSSGSLNGVSWNNSYKYSIWEKVFSADLSFLYSFTGNSAKYNLKLGVGPSYLNTAFHYPSDLYINRGVIERKVYDTHRFGTPMAHLVAAYDVNISNKLYFQVSGIFRSAFAEKSILERKEQYNDGYSSATSGVSYQFTFGMGLGYRF